MEQEILNNGLCREFGKAANDLVNLYRLPSGEYDFYYIGREIVRLHEEMF